MTTKRKTRGTDARPHAMTMVVGPAVPEREKSSSSAGIETGREWQTVLAKHVGSLRDKLSAIDDDESLTKPGKLKAKHELRAATKRDYEPGGKFVGMMALPEKLAARATALRKVLDERVAARQPSKPYEVALAAQRAVWIGTVEPKERNEMLAEAMDSKDLDALRMFSDGIGLPVEVTERARRVYEHTAAPSAFEAHHHAQLEAAIVDRNREQFVEALERLADDVTKSKLGTDRFALASENARLASEVGYDESVGIPTAPTNADLDAMSPNDLIETARKAQAGDESAQKALRTKLKRDADRQAQYQEAFA